ncbi:MAG: pyridoxal kinase PdxY [Burkholderiaceae bacterium]
MSELVLSIQSHVAFGHVGNDAAVFPLQRLGYTPVAIHTVQFSNHTGYGEFRGQVFSADHVREVIAGLRERGVLARCRAVLSGYLGDAAIGEAIIDAVAEIKSARPDALWCCDPVMGDVGRGIFVRPDIPEFLRDRATPIADVITPNQFEFEQLIGRPLTSRADAVASAREFIAAGRRAVVITSLRTPDVASDRLETLAVAADGAWIVATPYLPLAPLPNGMGDVFSAIFLGALLRAGSVPAALEHATASLYALVQATEPGSRDLPLVREQQAIVTPPQVFAAQALVL